MVIQLEQPCAVTVVPPRRAAMRIVVDRDLCQGHAMCVLEAPDVFACRRPAPSTCSTSPPPAGHADAVRPAVKYCPTHALSIEED